jgi:hypothetical protein
VTRILILDEIVVKPGRAADYRRAYRAAYVPGAVRRGLKLEQAWRNPPGQDFDELPTTLYWLWSVKSLEAWWAVRFAERFEKLAWWQEAEPMTLSRRRSVLTDQPADD